jgi:2-amino-4-hydroxy-6-hydroxymethyldihydropteridine diphosphokinase
VAEVYIACGSNLGDRLATIHSALDRIADLGVRVTTSPVYESEPVGYAQQPRFLNGVVQLQTDVPPTRLLVRLLEVEKGLGRERNFPNAPRTIDLDILLYDDRVIATPELTVPHPRMHERAFVLMPLVDLAPNLVHPIFGQRVDELLESLGPVSGVWRYE